MALAPTPIAFRSWAHPLVILETTKAKLASVQEPVEHSPAAQLAMVLGIDFSVPMTNWRIADGLRHAASCEASSPLTVFWQDVEMDTL